MVPTQQIPGFIELIRANSVVLNAGATLMDGLTGSPVIIPKQLSGAVVTWMAENATIPPSDLAVGQITMTPKKAGGLGAGLQQPLAAACGPG